MPPISLKFIVEGGMIHRVHRIFGAEPYLNVLVLFVNPGWRSVAFAPQSRDRGQGAPHSKSMPPWIGFIDGLTVWLFDGLTVGRNNVSNPGGVLLVRWSNWSPHTPSPLNKFHRWRGVWGDGKEIYILVWGGTFPFSYLVSILTSVFLDWDCPHPTIPLSSSIPTQPYDCVGSFNNSYIYSHPSPILD